MLTRDTSVAVTGIVAGREERVNEGVWRHSVYSRVEVAKRVRSLAFCSHPFLLPIKTVVSYENFTILVRMNINLIPLVSDKNLGVHSGGRNSRIVVACNRMAEFYFLFVRGHDVLINFSVYRSDRIYLEFLRTF